MSGARASAPKSNSRGRQQKQQHQQWSEGALSTGRILGPQSLSSPPQGRCSVENSTDLALCRAKRSPSVASWTKPLHSYPGMWGINWGGEQCGTSQRACNIHYDSVTCKRNQRREGLMEAKFDFPHKLHLQKGFILEHENEGQPLNKPFFPLLFLVFTALITSTT